MTTRLEKRLSDQKRNQKRRLLALAISAVLLCTVLVAGAVAYWVADSFGYLDKAKQAIGLSAKKINILVLGIDQRRNDIGRSNVTCVVTIDTGTKDVSMLWVPRDSRVKIPGHGWNKIGHAYAYEGPVLSKKTVEELLGIPIDYYLTVNMAGFSKVIDAVGGVDLYVEKRMYYYDPYDEGEVADNNGLIDLRPGQQHMDGNTALQYVRFRHDEMGDIGRIERQKKFSKALLAQVASPGVITRLPAILSEVNAAVKTDLPLNQMLSLGKIINDAYKRGLDTQTVPGKPVFIEGISYWLPDIVAMRKQVAEIQGIALDDKYMAAGRSLAAEYARALSGETGEGEASPATRKEAGPDKAAAIAAKPVAAASDKPRVEIVNASGQNGLGAKVSSILGGRGFTVAGVSTGTVRKNTVVVLPAANSGMADKLNELPFKYVLQVGNDNAKDAPVTIFIGQDYTP
ncbi:MAG: LCP family protein [Negativicutes bacterium]|nr:LCP family protein [Negativicutes bacterium]